MSQKTKLFYRCPEICEDSYYELETPYAAQVVKRFLDDFAVEAAENYHSHHDGWECTWPVVFTIHETEGGPELGRFSVGLEYEPTFHASPVGGE